MKTVLLALVGLAMLETLVSLFAGSDTMRRTVKLIGGTAMGVLLLSQVMQFDYAAYSAAIRTSRADLAWDRAEAEQTQARLNRMIIEAECSAYILDKAAAKGLPLSSAEVTLSWSTEGYWYPSGVMLTGTAADDLLADAIETDLGIPRWAQEWREDV